MSPSYRIRLQRRLRHQRARPTPWINADEFEEVGRGFMKASLLFSQRAPPERATNNQQQHSNTQDELIFDELSWARRRVLVWRARSVCGGKGHRLPHAVETTASLAELLMRDVALAARWSLPNSLRGSQEHLGVTSSSRMESFVHLPSAMELRHAYSSAIIRGVNGIADAAQRGRGLRMGDNKVLSVSYLCGKMGLPGWVVDLRHDAAHGDLPTLPCLQMAAKTLLEFFWETYWRVKIDERAQHGRNACYLLEKYRAAAKAEVLTTAQSAKAAVDTAPTVASPSVNEGVSIEYPAAAPASESPAVGIGLSQKMDCKERNDGEAPCVHQNEQTATAEKLGTPLDYAREYVFSVPVDVGIPTAVSFLVRGGAGELFLRKDICGKGECRIVNGRGVLIPGSLVAFPGNDYGIAKIRKRYDALLQTLHRAWGGFLHALMLDIVDFILDLVHNQKGNGECDGAEVLGRVGISNVDTAHGRKVFFLLSWVRYLLSREFHSVFNPSLAIPKTATREYETSGDHITRYAPLAVLRGAGIPVNSICDRCVSVEGASSSTVASDLVKLFEGVLKTDRVIEFGFGPGKDMKRKMLDDLEEAEKLLRESEEDETAASRAGDDEEDNNPMTLDEMENMLAADESDGVASDVSTQDEELKKQGSNGEHDDSESTPWQRCESWDSCAIGSLPGYPLTPSFRDRKRQCLH